MQAYNIQLRKTGTFSLDAIDTNLSLDANVPIPEPGTDKILVNIKAAALNYRDLLVLTSDPRYSPSTADQITPVADGAGIVVKAPLTSRWKPGDRVFLLPNSSWKEGMGQGDYDGPKTLGAGSVDGTLRQYAVLEDDDLAPLPEALTFEEGAAIGGAYGTAWNVLFGGPQPLRAGDVIVTQGTGGVSIAAIQLAVAAGAQIIALSSSDTKLELAKRLGATHTINYRTYPDWSVKVQELTKRYGASHVVDVGGAGTVVQSLRAVRNGGLVSLVGFLSESEKHDLVPEIIFGAKIVRGILVASVPMFNDLAAFLDEHHITPVVGSAFEWNDAKNAYRALASQDTVGKIVIKVD